MPTDTIKDYKGIPVRSDGCYKRTFFARIQTCFHIEHTFVPHLLLVRAPVGMHALNTWLSVVKFLAQQNFNPFRGEMRGAGNIRSCRRLSGFFLPGQVEASPDFSSPRKIHI